MTRLSIDQWLVVTVSERLRWSRIQWKWLTDHGHTEPANNIHVLVYNSSSDYSRPLLYIIDYREGSKDVLLQIRIIIPEHDNIFTIYILGHIVYQ